MIASAERRIFYGARPARAVEDALASIGPPRAVRKLLLRCERGGPVPLRMRGRSPRVPFAFTAAVAAIVLVRLFLVGAYAVEWNSMEPALAPRSEGGDALVLVNLRAFAASPPARGDIVVFQAPGGDALYVYTPGSWREPRALVYLGEHYVSDLLVGVACAFAAWLAASRFAPEIPEPAMQPADTGSRPRF